MKGASGQVLQILFSSPVLAKKAEADPTPGRIQLMNMLSRLRLREAKVHTSTGPLLHHSYPPATQVHRTRSTWRS